MDFLEKDLEEIIFSADKEKLSERGLSLQGKLLRQLRIGEYGIADIVTFRKIGYHMLQVDIYELKKDKVGIAAFLQAISYAQGILRYFNKRRPHMCIYVDIVLIGKTIDTSGSFCYLSNLISSDHIDKINNLYMYEYSYELEGILFSKKTGDYHLTNEGF